MDSVLFLLMENDMTFMDSALVIHSPGNSCLGVSKNKQALLLAISTVLFQIHLLLSLGLRELCRTTKVGANIIDLGRMAFCSR